MYKNVLFQLPDKIELVTYGDAPVGKLNLVIIYIINVKIRILFVANDIWMTTRPIVVCCFIFYDNMIYHRACFRSNFDSVTLSKIV